MPAPSHGPGGGHHRRPAHAAPCTDIAAGAAAYTDPYADTLSDTYADAYADADAVPRASAAAAEIVRWGVFSCALVPVVLLICGSSPGSAFGTCVGLAAVTAACRTLLRQSERTYAQHTYARFTPDRPGPHRGRHSRTGTGLHRGGRHPGQP